MPEKRIIVANEILPILDGLSKRYNKKRPTIMRIMFQFVFKFWKLSQLQSTLIYRSDAGEETELDFLGDVALHLPSLDSEGGESTVRVKFNAKEMEQLDEVRKELDFTIQEVVLRGVIFYNNYLCIAEEPGALLLRKDGQDDKVLVRLASKTPVTAAKPKSKRK
ncbi:MAG: hypothetical protein P1V97_08590 [Planctomycetota bacterium]|nr:hypothetical protein [Planctomycetota bacterium]